MDHQIICVCDWMSANGKSVDDTSVPNAFGNYLKMVILKEEMKLGNSIDAN